MTGLRLLGGGIIPVAEDYDTAVEKFWSSSGPPASALEARGCATWHTEDGDRILVLPQNISAIIEHYVAEGES